MDEQSRKESVERLNAVQPGDLIMRMSNSPRWVALVLSVKEADLRHHPINTAKQAELLLNVDSIDDRQARPILRKVELSSFMASTVQILPRGRSR